MPWCRLVASTATTIRTDDAVPIRHVAVEAFLVPTDAHESDGTFEWDATTLVLVTLAAGGVQALGYTYADRSSATLIAETLAPLVGGRNAFDAVAIRDDLVRAVRNLGSRGIAATAISAIPRPCNRPLSITSSAVWNGPAGADWSPPMMRTRRTETSASCPRCRSSAAEVAKPRAATCGTGSNPAAPIRAAVSICSASGRAGTALT